MASLMLYFVEKTLGIFKRRVILWPNIYKEQIMEKEKVLNECVHSYIPLKNWGS